MSEMHPTMQRLYDAAKARHGLSGQSEVARAMNMSPQRLNNWEARGISQEGANQAQALLGVNATWILSGGDEYPAVLEKNSPQTFTKSSRLSQTPRIDADMLSQAMRLIELIDEIRGGSAPTETYPARLSLAYEVVAEEIATQGEGNVVQMDMARRLAARLRQNGGDDEGGDKRGKAARTSN